MHEVKSHHSPPSRVRKKDRGVLSETIDGRRIRGTTSLSGGSTRGTRLSRCACEEKPCDKNPATRKFSRSRWLKRSY